MNYCVYCGTELDPMDGVCPECGAEILDPPPHYTPFEKLSSAAEPVKPAENDKTQKALSPGDYIVSIFLLSIPILGQIVALVWALGAATNRNRRNLAAGVLLLQIICAAICVGLYFVLDYFQPVWITNFLEALTPLKDFIM